MQQATRFVLGSSLALLSACGASSPRAGESARRDAPSIEDVLGVRAPGDISIAPDGAVFVRDWPDGVNQLYRLQPDGALSRKLTDFADGLASYSLSPDGRTIVLAAAAGGNEQTQLHVLRDPRSDSGPVEPLLSDPKAQFRLNAWLDDSSGFVFTTNESSPSDFHIHRYDFASGQRTKLLEREGSWSASDVSRDGRRLLCQRTLSASDARLYALDAGSGALTAFQAEGAETSRTSGVGWLADEAWAVCTSDIEGGTSRVWLWNPATGERKRPLAALDAFEVDSVRLNEERTLLAVVVNEAGYGVLHLYRLPGFEEVQLPGIERGVTGVSELAGDTLVWSVTNARSPGLAFRYRVPASGVGSAEPLTRADTRGLDLARFVEPELVRYRSFDGLEIPAFLYLPRDRREGEPVPFVVNYHGGPEGQHRPGFDRTAQLLVSRGFGVLQPNVRGSTGYGRAFQRLDDYERRWDSVKDGVEAARWLVSAGFAAEGRIATYGGSYGGFMSVATLVEGGALFGAGIDVVGIVNMQTFLEQTSGYRRKLREAEYGPLSDPEFLKSISPLFRAREIQVPMLIAHGLNDPRVPIGEAMQLAEELSRLGHEPEQVYFHDEGHGFQKLENRLHFHEHMLAFLERTIGAG